MTVADLARRSKATLTSAKNLGRGSVGSLVAAIAGHRVRVEAARARAGIGFLEGWKTLLQDHEAVPRMVLTLRAALGGRAEKLQAIGELLGVTRERIRQIEARTIEDLRQERLFLEEARGRFDAALVHRITGLVDRSEYKRRQMPPGVRISKKAFGRDRRMPITNNFRPSAR